jgi:hypothetical protein
MHVFTSRYTVALPGTKRGRRESATPPG